MIDKKQLDNLEYFNCLGSMTTNGAICTGRRDIKCRIIKEKASFRKK
jgi:hypothetical protein